MIPQTGDDLRQDFEFETLPSRTFRLNHNTLTIIGTIDEIEAVEQAVYLILNITPPLPPVQTTNGVMEAPVQKLWFGELGRPLEVCL